MVWLGGDISEFYSLFRLKKSAVDELVSREWDKPSLDGLTVADLEAIQGINPATAKVMVQVWHKVCTFRQCPKDALIDAREMIEMWSDFSTIASTHLKDITSCDCPQSRNIELPSLSPHYIELKTIIDEQKSRIETLELRELDSYEELQRREQLIGALQSQLIVLQNSLDTQAKTLNLLVELFDHSQSLFLSESEKLRSSFNDVANSILSLNEVFESSQQDLQTIPSAYLQPIQLDHPCLPIFSIQKITCSILPSDHCDPSLSSMDPYIVVSNLGNSQQSDTLPGAICGSSAEWRSVIELETDLTRDNKINVEIWNQYSIHEAHLVAQGVATIALDSFKESDPFQILLNLMDENSNPIEGEITLLGTLNNNLLSHVPCHAKHSKFCGVESKWDDSLSHSFDLLLSSKMEIPQNDFFDPLLSSCRLLMQSLHSSQVECSLVTSSSTKLFHIQEFVSQNLSNSITNCESQINGMKDYARSLYPLIEKLRTERSYMDILAETELRSEQTINIMKTNYIELDRDWELKYRELESTSSLRYNQLVLESREKYEALVASTNLAYAELRATYEAARMEISSLSDQLTESFTRYEKLKLNYEEICRRLDAEMQALAAAKLKISSLESELEDTIEIVRKDMASRCISKNAAEDLLTLSSQILLRDDLSINNIDWDSLFLNLTIEMTESQISEFKVSMINLKNSYDIINSRLFLECQARVEIEKVLNDTKEDLEMIKSQILSEVQIRKQLEEELKFAKELAANESKFATVAKKTAEDAIKQARYFQRKLNRELDHFRDNINGTDVIGELSLTLPDDASEIGDDPAVPISPINRHGSSNSIQSRKSRPKSAGSKHLASAEENFYANLVLTPDGKTVKRKSESGSISRRSKNSDLELENSPYSQHLSPRSRKLIHRGQYHPSRDSKNGSFHSVPKHFSNDLQTNSESDLHTREKDKSQSTFGKSKRFLKNVVKKSLSGRSKSNSSVAPSTEADERGERPEWVDPNTKDYTSKKYDKKS